MGINWGAALDRKYSILAQHGNAAETSAQAEMVKANAYNQNVGNEFDIAKQRFYPEGLEERQYKAQETGATGRVGMQQEGENKRTKMNIAAESGVKAAMSKLYGQQSAGIAQQLRFNDLAQPYDLMDKYNNFALGYKTTWGVSPNPAGGQPVDIAMPASGSIQGKIKKQGVRESRGVTGSYESPSYWSSKPTNIRPLNWAIKTIGAPVAGYNSVNEMTNEAVDKVKDWVTYR
jgi:hypothetical protein